MICTDDQFTICASETSLVVFAKGDGSVQSEITLSASILAMHASYGYLAVGTDDKRVHLYSMPTCAHVCSIDVLKRCSSLYVADYDGQAFVLVADKFAEVWAYPVANKMTSRTFMLQHPTSSITQMRVVPALGQMFTADQDEKIRVSNYPASHVVANYCLGHTSIVSSIDVVTVSSRASSDNSDSAAAALPAVLVSGGGDGTLRSWNPKTGALLQTIRFDSTTLDAVQVAATSATSSSSSSSSSSSTTSVSSEDKSTNTDNVVVSFVVGSKTQRAVTFAVLDRTLRSKIHVATIDAHGTMHVVSGQMLNGTVVGIVSIGENDTHVLYADQKGQLAWYHSETSTSANVGNTETTATSFTRALDNWALKAPLVTANKVSATAPRGERVRERAEETAQAQQQQKKAKLNHEDESA
jgi:hypothetical protein